MVFWKVFLLLHQIFVVSHEFYRWTAFFPYIASILDVTREGGREGRKKATWLFSRLCFPERAHMHAWPDTILTAIKYFFCLPYMYLCCCCYYYQLQLQSHHSSRRKPLLHGPDASLKAQWCRLLQWINCICEHRGRRAHPRWELKPMELLWEQVAATLGEIG